MHFIQHFAQQQSYASLCAENFKSAQISLAVKEKSFALLEIVDFSRELCKLR